PLFGTRHRLGPGARFAAGRRRLFSSQAGRGGLRCYRRRVIGGDESSSNTDDGRQAVENFFPAAAFVARAEKLASTSSKINSCRIERVGRHCIAENRFVGEFLRQTARKWLPGCSAVARAIDAKAAVTGAAELVGLDGDDVRTIGIARMNDNGESKIGRDAVGDVLPVFAVIVRAIKTPVILQEKAFGMRRMHRNFVNALAELGIFVGQKHSADAAILCGPGLAAVAGAINATRGNCDVHAPVVGRIEHDRMQSEAAIAGHPSWTMRMIEKATDEEPSFARVAGFEERGRFDAAVENIRLLGAARSDLPDIFQRDAGVRREANGRFLRIGPALSEIVAEAEKRAPIILGGSPDAATA